MVDFTKITCFISSYLVLQALTNGSLVFFESVPYLRGKKICHFEHGRLLRESGNDIPRTTRGLQLDCRSVRRTRIINLPENQKGYDTFETTVGKLSARRIQIYPDYFCLGIILKVILNNFQNNV